MGDTRNDTAASRGTDAYAAAPDPAAADPGGARELQALRSIVEGTARTTGQAFFQSLVQHLAAAVGARYAFVAEFADTNTRVRTLAYWRGDRVAPNVEFDLDGTPCQEVVRGSLCHYPRGVREKFHRDAGLVSLKTESYLGVPLLDGDGKHLGHLAVFDDRPMPPEPRTLFIFRIFAARATAELERVRAERLLGESERRFRDLYEEAPIAYIFEDLESRFVRANRAAVRLLGLKPDEVAGTIGKSLLAPTPQTHQRVREALAAMQERGQEFAGVELELRRKNDGRPVWVQWWSKPEPDGKHTRTMLVDVTERVLMEQEKARLHQQNVYLQEEIKSEHNFEEIVGRSPSLMAVLDGVRQVAATDATVLVLGETGTGKELIARAVHSHSRRRDKPLIKVNCAALPTGLVESELFGHERGAFSGAIAKRVGRFELAHGGTIFLDEIGELPLELQAKLLRVLQEREFERVGGAAAIKADVRVIAATNRDLLNAVRAGTFREDLYYRLNVFPVRLPPLRERADDIPLLVQFLLNRFGTRIGKRVDGVTPQTMRRLLAYPWPGNVRELENLLERAVILASGNVIDLDPQPAGVPEGSDVGSALADAELVAARNTSAKAAPAGHANRPVLTAADGHGGTPPVALEDVQRAHILAVLNQTNWVVEGARGAARMLDLHPNTLRSRMKKMGIARASQAPAASERSGHEPS